jgi:hypothetical protein
MEHPVTVVLWKKNGKLISEDGSRIKMNKSNGTLVISEVELDDHGNYSCLVNTTGFRPVHSKPATVLVKGRSHIFGRMTQAVLLTALCLVCQGDTDWFETDVCKRMGNKHWIHKYAINDTRRLVRTEILRFTFSQIMI